MEFVILLVSCVTCFFNVFCLYGLIVGLIAVPSQINLCTHALYQLVNATLFPLMNQIRYLSRITFFILTWRIIYIFSFLSVLCVCVKISVQSISWYYSLLVLDKHWKTFF